MGLGTHEVFSELQKGMGRMRERAEIGGSDGRVTHLDRCHREDVASKE